MNASENLLEITPSDHDPLLNRPNRRLRESWLFKAFGARSSVIFFHAGRGNGGKLRRMKTKFNTFFIQIRLMQLFSIGGLLFYLKLSDCKYIFLGWVLLYFNFLVIQGSSICVLIIPLKYWNHCLRTIYVSKYNDSFCK